jgi:integral membrane sensor domain MASE1
MPSQNRYTEIALAPFAAICLAGAELGQVIVVSVGGVDLPAVWPPIGILAGALILADPARWVKLVATSCLTIILSAVLHGHSLLPALALSVLAGVEASAIAWFVQRRIDGPFALNRFSHTWALAIWGTLVPAVIAALASSLLFGVGPSFLTGWRARWLGDVLGLLMMAPMVIATFSHRDAFGRIARSWKALEMAVVFLGAIVITVVIFGEEVDPLLRIPAYVLPFLLWPVFRFGPGASSANLFIVAFIGLWNANQGHGPFAMVGAPPASIVLRSQGSMVVVALSFLLLASVVAERKRVAQEYAALVTELQRAMAEIKTLQGFIPICAWCHKVRDDAGFWQQIEKYIDARTDATFSHSICPGCAERAHDEITAHGLSDRVS